MSDHPYERYDKIEKLLRREALSIPEVASALGYSTSMTRRDVLVLVEADQVERLGVTPSGATTYRSKS